MKLRNPPIVEAWIDYRFGVGPDLPSDPAGTAARLLAERFGNELPDIDWVVQDVFRVLEDDPRKGGRAEVGQQILSVRAANPTETEFVQMGPDFVSVNFVRPSGGDYPGYTVLRDRSLDLLEIYSAEFRPERLQSFALHNVDRVPIPRGAGGVRLEDWFHLSLAPPQGFGASPHGFSLTFRQSTPIPGVEMLFTVRTEEDSSDDEAAWFRFGWHLTGAFDAEPDRETIRGRLDAVHEHLNTAFRATFTERAWSTFDPEADAP